jgi:pre-mRNA-splicing helicase BRR2
VVVTVTLSRDVDEGVDSDGNTPGSTLEKVVAPKYPCEKTESWWLLIGDTASNALLSVKRVSFGSTNKVT